MKLPIKQKYFDLIKSGEKIIEVRDAHITFVCEETGEKLTKNVLDVKIRSRSAFPQYSDVLGDDSVISFLLGEYRR